MQLRMAVVITGLVALTLTGCSADSDPPSDDPAAKSAGATTTTQDAASSGPENAESTGSGSTGTVTVDGITVTFTPRTCLLSPGSTDLTITGPGKTDSGEPAYVAVSGPNQLTVYLDADPMNQQNDHYEFNPMATGGGPMDELQGLEVSDGTVTAAPEMVRANADKTTFDPVGPAKLKVTCD